MALDILVSDKTITWHQVAKVDDFPYDGGENILVEGKQIAVFYFTSRNEWFATQNLCPHKQQMVLSRGMIGEKAGEPKVACPFHKKNFSLKSGECLDDNACGDLETYPVKVEDGNVFIGLT